MGDFSIITGSNHQYRMYNGLVQRWTSGVDFVRNFYENVPLTAITDAFVGGPLGAEFIYAYQASSGYWKQNRDESVAVVTTATEYNAQRTSTIAIILDGSVGIEVSFINGAVSFMLGVTEGNVTIASNATHMQVSINLGISTVGTRRQVRGFRTIGGSERELITTRTRSGGVYSFVFLKTVDGSSSVTLIFD